MKKLRLHFFGLFTKDVKKLRLSQTQAKKLVKKLRQETGLMGENARIAFSPMSPVS
jgi:hypothetical protein